MTLSILGNLFLLFVILRGNYVSRRRISPVQLLLIHTCVADLLFALLSLGTEILTMITWPQFNGSDWMCKAMRYCQMLPHYASPFLLVAISADRYQAICRPLANFRASRYRRPNYLAAIAWVLSLICSIPQLIIWEKRSRHRNEHKIEECATIYGHEKNIIKNIYVIVFNTIAWLLPSIFAGYFYYRVCKAVWMSGTRAPKVAMEQKEPVKGDITQDYIENLRKKSYGFRRQTYEFDRKRVQTVRLTMTIIVCNFFLWMPFCVVNVVLALWPSLLTPSFYLYVMTLGNLNSCVNPWIYILFNRSHVTKALCGRRETNSYASHRSENDLRSIHKPSPSLSTKLSPEASSVKVHRNVSFQASSTNDGFKSADEEMNSKPLVRNQSLAGVAFHEQNFVLPSLDCSTEASECLLQSAA
ncbi:unnamed protein product [Auanema sp. JU1783]|nr:unnamed protein product [Auanema sp. JU1783]